jgi:hypothetical protein
LKSAFPNHDDIYRHFDLFQGASQSNAFSSGVFYFISGNDQHIQIAILCDFASRVGTEQNDLFWVGHKLPIFEARQPAPRCRPPGIAQWDPDQQAAEVSTGDAQKLARLVSRELFVKPAKEKSLPGLRVESPARGATELGRKASWCPYRAHQFERSAPSRFDPEKLGA